MDSLIEKAKGFLDRNYDINEIELADGVNRVRLVRHAPIIQYSEPRYTPTQYVPYYHYPNY